MAAVVLIEPTELYNILNQETKYPCLSDTNFLLLLDARNTFEYDQGHVITARRARVDVEGQLCMPYDAELECKTHVIIYDSNCRSRREKSPAVMYATLAANSGSKNPVKILRGGYEDFSAMYPFLRTQKIIYMPMENDEIETFPCEVLPGILYIGSSKHARSTTIHKELKIRAHVNMSSEKDAFFNESNAKTYLQVPIEDRVDADLTSHMDAITKFIDRNRAEVNTIMVWSSNGISRSAAACILYLMSYYKWPLRDAWRHMRLCKFTIRPNRGLVQQLAEFERRKFDGEQQTDISDPYY